MTISHLRLKNIACDFCADVIERAVCSLPGVHECLVSTELKQATVQYAPQYITLEAIQNALVKAGYEVECLDK
ncbi:heavy-metal-associated domain-containing protein [Acaryochloris sp. CCMEE 5410]|uniref:heavy-metal-associated domain-containing protein n=1 Tax=Acaryochloris sp. CCMEE 5410 TaxID=310037 RepID=UPI0002DB7B2C|nr:heavy-metal-associated domain-containing protein [Acaryochloris sp. CCMEE 5410]KAI9130061.1 heavy-metal-associated domain-containing protein [Acaryochloris sp. CCMEE 5410]